MEHTLTSAEHEARAEFIMDVAVETVRIEGIEWTPRAWIDTSPRFVFTDEDLDESLYR